jgi:hypothetical protein
MKEMKAPACGKTGPYPISILMAALPLAPPRSIAKVAALVKCPNGEAL